MKKNKKNRKPITRIILFVIILVLILFQPLSIVIINRERFFNKGYQKQYDGLKRVYEVSQYTTKNSSSYIPDETFEAYAGGAFLKGLNPILIVHDHPPLGRYIVSLSILLFDNSQTIIVFMLALSFLGIFLISKRILKNELISLLPLAIFANEPLTIGKLLYAPLPEPIQLPFIIFSIYFFMVSADFSKKIPFYVTVSFLLGIVISTRFFITGLVLLFSFLFFLLLKKEFRNILLLVLTLPLSLLILILSYTRTIQSGYSILQVFSIQKYILVYHKSAFVVPLSFWDLLLFNRWHTWWGNNSIISDPQWQIAWPAAVFLSIFKGIWVLIKKAPVTSDEIIIFLWVLFYCLTLSVGYTSTRYFMPILPFLYILGVSSMVYLVRYKLHAKENS